LDRRAFFLAFALVLACRGEDEPAPPAHQGPIVLITIDALRADVPSPKLTPNLGKLAAEATWAGSGVSPSSWTVPSMASLFTGLQPWSVQSWSSDRSMLRDDLVTLPEALKTRGYRTAGFRTNHWLERVFGYAQGFDEFRYLANGKRAENHLEKLGPGREFVWVHILQPHAPYVKRAYLEGHLENALAGLPDKVRPLDLEPYYDPDVPLPPEQERVFRAMYELNAAYADDLLGRMVAALRRSGQWDRTLLVVTSDHGEEFGEMEQIAHGGNLGRQLVEVPLMVKLPSGFGPKLAVKAGQRPATNRIRATLLEAAGWKPEEGTAPSLFHDAEETGVLSELYAGNGVNRFSYVEGDLQLLWESRFSPSEPEYYRARYEGVGGRLDRPLAEPSKAIFGRLEQSFARTLPLTGLEGDEPRLTLWRWSERGSEQVDDPAATERLARRLRSAWIAANGKEKVPGKNTGRKPQLTPEQEAELRALGYIH